MEKLVKLEKIEKMEKIDKLNKLDKLEKHEFVCKNCQCYFDSLQDCLRHDLLKHINLQRINEKNPHVAKLHQLWTIFEKKENERQKVHEALENCVVAGQELQEIFKIYCMDCDKKDKVLNLVISCLTEDLKPLKNVEIQAFGSINNGLMMIDSDIDIYTRTTQSKSFYRNSTYYQIIELLRHGKHFTDVIPIPQARVPIIKCRHVGTYLKIDINCACPDSVENTKFVREILNFDMRLRTMMRFIKIWAKRHQLIGHGLMTCYCLTTLVLFFLQQTQHRQQTLIPSVQKMQSDEPSMMIQGINYAFNIHKHMMPLPADLQTSTLIRSFFIYYHQFDFHRLMVATHLGVTVSLTDFRSGKFHYAAYENQLTVLKTTGFKAKVKSLCTERDMVVQDSFQLNQNLAKSVTQAHFNYFHQCIENAFRICTKISAPHDAQLYEALLFDLFDAEITKISTIKSIPSQVTKQPSPFVCSLMPNHAEPEVIRDRTLNLRNDETDASHRQWALHTVELIWTVLKKIYCLDVYVCPNSKESVRFDCADTLKTTMFTLKEKNMCTWGISGSVNMWTGRKYRCIGAQTFVRYQQLLTKALMLERSKMSEFAVDFNVCLTIHADENCSVLKLEFNQNQWSETDEKKAIALQKFFENFKCIMQSLNVEKMSLTEGNVDC